MPQQGRNSIVETTGALPLPDTERASTRRNIVGVFAGGNFWWGAALYGWIVAQFGLGFWATLSAVLAGSLAGTLLVAPLAALTYRTGTNVPVASTILFGARGRFIGTFLSFVVALIFTALTVWTSGDALVASSQRLLGTPAGGAEYAIGYALVAILICLIAVLGHEVIVGAHRYLAVISGALMLLGIVAFAPSFSAEPVAAAQVLGSPFPTWALAFTLGFSAPISYAPILGDYTRKLTPGRYSGRSVASTVVLALVIASWVPAIVGSVLAFSLHGASAGSFIPDLVQTAPGWYVIPILIVAITGGFGQGVMGLYSTGLDLASISPKFSRVATTLVSGLIAVALVYIGSFAFDIASSVEAIAILLGCLIAPWAALVLVGTRARDVNGHALASLGTSAMRNSPYWFHSGWNLRASAAWLLGSLFGILAANTQLLVGPLAGSFGGVDVSIMGSIVVAVAAFAVLSLIPGGSPRPGAHPRSPVVAEA